MTAVLGPISAALEADLRDWVRRHGIVVWLDIEGLYSGFVDRLAGLRGEEDLSYEVLAYRGSYLELMLALEPLTSGVERTRMVIHMPGFNEESVASTPVYQLYVAGARYRKALDTLVREAAAGRVRPEQIVAFLQQESLTLEGADTWLAELLDDRTGGLRAQLRSMRLTAVVEDLLTGGPLSERLTAADDRAAVWESLQAWTGLTTRWLEEALPQAVPSDKDTAFAVSSWALAVEYVHDLRRPPVNSQLEGMRDLPGPVIEACRELAAHLRERAAAFYQRTANETEARLADEVEAAQAQDLGRIDTFRFEEDKVLEAALAALEDKNWSMALEWAAARLDGDSFWLREEPSHRSAWELVQSGANLGMAITAAGPVLKVRTGLDEAVQRYVEQGAAVDRAHRHLEQRRASLLVPQLPEFETLRGRLDALRRLWREWADAWARDFNALCKAEGFLPSPSFQQRTLFEDVVRPLTREPGTTALFLVDALRFEMGEELLRTLADTASTKARLEARLAELPTVTEVGMRVLAPIAERGKLRPILSNGKIQAFATNVFQVSDLETRKRAMHERVGGATSPWLSLEDVVSRDAASLKHAIARAKLMVVYSEEIDRAGENGLGPAVFDQAMQKLRSAWRLLRDAGVRRFVFTADHGFLLLDETVREAQVHGRKIDPKRRHVFSPVAANHRGEVRVALADLGYEGLSEHLMFPETTAVFDTGRRRMSFVHGGNSLQERVIPVLTLFHRSPAGSDATRYAVSAQAREAVAGMHCLEAKVEVADQEALDFGRPQEVELTLRAVEPLEVQVELCQTRGGARLASGTLMAQVSKSFELFFRLSGPEDTRVRVGLFPQAGEAEVEPGLVDERFMVSAVQPMPMVGIELVAPPPTREWLAELPGPEVRQVFEHLALHGVLTEAEAATMLGGQRALRRFALQFETYAARVPFGVRIDVVGGVKRYIREGRENEHVDEP
ncbi:MAG TPA: BREX-6 system phosphatase PglZ [Thermoanaerobaculia bacterium]|nr:BREX-6 system phosphatase PglZ [Thermoanaerobaculia bacterium]